jgi:transposase-like protein
MGIGVKRSQSDYTMAFKLSVVEQVEKGELTYKEAQARYGIQGRSTVLVWLRKHGRFDWRKLSLTDLKRKSVMSHEKLPLTPDQRIKELEVELKQAQLKAQLFEAMLDVIKTEYGVKIPKKPLSVSLKKKKLFESA